VKQRTKTSRPRKDRQVAACPGCTEHPEPIDSLGKFHAVCSSVLRRDNVYWFRGHCDISWRLTPFALRYTDSTRRRRALGLLADFKRYVESRLRNPPPREAELKWVQHAQHYGLPTRLLDWTASGNVALYFACLSLPKTPECDGGVIVLNPKDLNRQSTKEWRIFDAHSDAEIINAYLALGEDEDPKGTDTIAINPVWDSERIACQRGAFTLHGSKNFTLTLDQAPSLVCFRIPRESKGRILDELELAGTDEMSIFPEPEHVCRYLIWRERLDTFGAQ
jgi:hypothetical protein